MHYQEFHIYYLKFGYKGYTTKLYNVKSTLFNEKTISSINDDYFASEKNKYDKVKVFENDNHYIVLTKYATIIYTKADQKHLKDYTTAIKLIVNRIINNVDINFSGIIFEAGTMDYVSKIGDIEKSYKGLMVEQEMKEAYNIKRDEYKSLRDENVEQYLTEYNSEYFSETGVCYNKNVNFATADYYNEYIGRIVTKIRTYYFNSSNNFITKNDILDSIDKLKEQQFEILLRSMYEEYIQKIF